MKTIGRKCNILDNKEIDVNRADIESCIINSDIIVDSIDRIEVSTRGRIRLSRCGSLSGAIFQFRSH